MNGIIITNAYSKSISANYQPNRLAEEFFKLNINCEIIKNNKFYCEINDSLILNNLKKYDFCVYLDKDKYVLNTLSQNNIKVFNNNEAINVCDDKMLTFLKLNNTTVMPDTIAGLLCYDKKAVIDDKSANFIIDKLGLPLIVKECYGSLGKGVYLVENKEKLLYMMDKLKFVPHLFQKFISSSFGRDLRVIVVGDKVLGGILRRSDNDFRSNISLGGFASVYNLNHEIIEKSLIISKKLKLDYCGIDFLFDDNDKTILCEVNSNAFFENFEKITDINVAKEYAVYILNKLDKK